MIVEIDKKKELLVEQTIYSSQENHISIHCNPGESRGAGFFLDPYIKIYDGPSFTNSKNSVRVHLIDMGLNYSHDDGKGDFILTSKTKKLLNFILTIQTDQIEIGKDKKPYFLSVEEYIKKYIEVVASDIGCKSVQIPKLNFENCRIRAGKEPKNETRKKFHI